MRKQVRRLWLGDWQRDEEEPAVPQPVAADHDQDDTVVFIPEDAEPRPAQRPTMRRAIAVAAAAAALCALLLALTSGNSEKQPTAQSRQAAAAQVPPVQAPQAQPQIPVPQGQVPQGFGGPDLTGAEATRAAEAAVAKYPGDVERVTRGPTGGGYIVHVIQPDGNEVHVAVDG